MIPELRTTLQREVFDAWAPPGATWSAWAKPVMFAHLYVGVGAGEAEAMLEMASPEPCPWCPPADGRTLCVIDIAGSKGVDQALSLARLGYRPVPLYNALPGSRGPLGSKQVIDYSGVAAALERAARELVHFALPDDAPPAFVLDARRRGTTTLPPVPGDFDNRSVSLPTDFPSGHLLVSRGIRRALLVQVEGGQPQVDLAHTLLRWQEAGIEIWSTSPEATATPKQITVSRPSMFRLAWQRALATLRLRKAPLGGFGGVIPIHSEGGGGGFVG